MTKQKAIIWDIDGTVADREERHPFDYTTVKNDKVKENILHIYKALYEYQYEDEDRPEIIFITGRPEICRKDTEEWLGQNGFGFNNKLYMRPNDNREQDARLKLQIYKESIVGYYDVIAVFEDRSRVVQMWRQVCGLTVLQVAEGEF